MRPNTLFVLGVALGGCYMDIKIGRVWNLWILSGWVTGIAFQIGMFGFLGLPRFFLGAVLPLALLFPLFRFRMLGAGDIKLLSVLGGLLGIRDAWKCICFSFFLGAVFSLFILCFCGNLKERFRYFFHYMLEYQKTGRRRPYRKSGARMENYPFTIPILLSVILYAGGFY